MAVVLQPPAEVRQYNCRTNREPNQPRAGPTESRTNREPDQPRAGPTESRTNREPDQPRAGGWLPDFRHPKQHHVDMTLPSSPPTISPITLEKSPQALSLVFNRLEPEAREKRVNALLDDIRAGLIPGNGILAAWRGGRMVGAMFAQAQVGRTAVIWPPSVVAEEPRETLDSLIETALGRFADENVCVVHAVLDFSTPEDNDLFRRGGFEWLADLIYLVSETRHFPAIATRGAFGIRKLAIPGRSRPPGRHCRCHLRRHPRLSSPERRSRDRGYPLRLSGGKPIFGPSFG